MKSKIVLIGAVVLAGCGAATTGGGGNGAAAQRSNGPDTCYAARYAALVGQDAVTALQIPEPKRSYRPDEAITLDANPARVNVVLDETDVIMAITCG